MKNLWLEDRVWSLHEPGAGSKSVLQCVFAHILIRSTRGSSREDLFSGISMMMKLWTWQRAVQQDMPEDEIRSPPLTIWKLVRKAYKAHQFPGESLTVSGMYVYPNSKSISEIVMYSVVYSMISETASGRELWFCLVLVARTNFVLILFQTNVISIRLLQSPDWNTEKATSTCLILSSWRIVKSIDGDYFDIAGCL